MSASRAFIAAFAVALPLASAGTAAAYHTRFVADNCNAAAPTPTSYITRDGSATVALRGRYEGYQWGGGCWNDNDQDDSPGDPHEDPNTGGEGGDCSGFTFKVWRESLNQGDADFYQWGLLRNVHGPYRAIDFKAGVGAAERHCRKVGARQDGCACERWSHRTDLRREPGRIGSSDRSEGRGVRHEHLDAYLSRKLELQRCPTDRVELVG